MLSFFLLLGSALTEAKRCDRFVSSIAVPAAMTEAPGFAVR